MVERRFQRSIQVASLILVVCMQGRCNLGAVGDGRNCSSETMAVAAAAVARERKVPESDPGVMPLECGPTAV